ncbi:MAG: NAD(P)H-binding protein [Bacteroidia bacterium]|nr:NAD(P)H-binding protein [Bacteroidia bacterium]
MNTAIIAGAPGLIGSQLLNNLLENNFYDKIIALVRKEISIQSPKLTQVIVDYNNLQSIADNLKCDDVFCCLGTTIKKAGSQDEFYKVDFQYCLNLAIETHKNGASNFYLVSALGANANSKVFYNSVKGKLENAINNIGFNSFYIFRPSVLLGKRNEFRLGEKIMQIILKPLSKLMVGSMKKYAAIESKKVAKTMLYFALSNNKTGKQIITNEQMLDL